MARLVLEQGPAHGALVLDLDSTIIWANAAAALTLGYTLEDLIGVHISAIFTPEERGLGIPAVEVDIARAGVTSEDDRWQQKQDGTRFWASGALVPLHDEAGRLIGFGKIFRNRTTLRQQFVTLQNQLRAAATRGTRLHEYIATLAHELRNPLTPLMMTSTMLRAASEDPRVRDAAAIIERQVLEMTRVIDRALDSARRGAERIPLERGVVSVNALLEDVQEDMRAAANARLQQLDLIGPESELLVVGDRSQLVQVFANLVGNAVKFTGERGRIWIKLTKEGAEVVARVEDTGIGLSHEKMEGIFEMFARADPGGDIPGTGVGLAIVKSIVEQHEGTVQVESEGPGTGCKFTVRLPMLMADPEDEESP